MPSPACLSRWLAATALVGVSGAAHAERWTGQAEAGVEVDSNVTRVPGDDAVGAGALRLGGRGGVSGDLLAGAYTLGAGATWRDVQDDALAAEDHAIVSGDAAWRRRLADDTVAIGLRASGYDVVGLGPTAPARAFRAVGAAAVVTLYGERDRQLSVDAGGRDVRYKPDPDHDWRGPSLGVQLTLPLWTSTDDTRQLDLELTARADARAYDGLALISLCPPEAPLETGCVVPSDQRRQDLVQVASVEATYTGRAVWSAGYTFTRDASTSLGQSLRRHRLNLAGTVLVPGEVYLTATLTLQAEQYRDGLLIAEDVTSQTFLTLDDDNRSSLQLRAARGLGHGVALELRVAGWRDLGGADATRFRRGAVGLGLTWSK